MKAFVKGDIDGFIALWLDNLVVAIVMVKLSLGFPLYLDPHLFYSRLMPASAVGLLIGNLYYAWLAHRLARREKRTDVCALPFGLARTRCAGEPARRSASSCSSLLSSLSSIPRRSGRSARD